MSENVVTSSVSESPGAPGTMQQIENYIRHSRFDSLKSDPDDHIVKQILQIENRLDQIKSEISFILFFSSATLATMIVMIIVKAMD